MTIKSLQERLQKLQIICGLIYNCCERAKHGLKEEYATSHARDEIYKIKLDWKMCAPAHKLWPMRTLILETRGDKDGELVNSSKIAESKCDENDSNC